MITNMMKDFLKEHTQKKNLNNYLIGACECGNLEIIKYLLTSPGLKEYIDIKDNYVLIIACNEGYLEVVKYLLTSPDLKEHAYIDDIILKNSCQNGHLDIVKYLLTSPDLKEHADIHANNDSALRYACKFGNLEIIKYLLTSPELKDHANIYEVIDVFFISSLITKEALKIIEWLIFDYKIIKTGKIEHWIYFNHDDNFIKNMFDKRDLQDKLLKELKNNEVITKRTKI